MTEMEGSSQNKSYLQLYYLFKSKNEVGKSQSRNNINSLSKDYSKQLFSKFTSIICGEPFIKISKENQILRKIMLVSKILTTHDAEMLDSIIKKLTQDNNQIGGLLSVLISHILKLLYNTTNPPQKSIDKNQDANGFQNQLQSLINLLSALFKSSFLEQKIGHKFDIEIDFISLICDLLLEQKKDNLESIFVKFHKFFFDSLNQEFPQIAEFFQHTSPKIKAVFKILQDLLDKPLLNLEDENLIQDILELVKQIDKDAIDNKLVTNLIDMIVKCDFQSLLQMVEYTNLVSQSEFKIIKESIVKCSSLSIFQNRGTLSHLRNTKPVVSDQVKEISKRMQEGKITMSDMFYSIDTDGSGQVSMEEFCNFLRRTGVSMSEHRVNELFATIKKNRNTGDNKNDGYELNFEEFEEAYKYINNKKTDMSLEKLGISPTLLALSLGTLIIILLLLLVFIFLGIKAFALGGTFGSIINSIIPAVTTSGTASSSTDKSSALKEDNIKDVMKETQLILHSKQL